MAVLVFSWAYRAADGRRHDFTFLNQGTFFLKWGTFFLLFLTFPYFLYTLERQKKKGKRTAAKEKRTAARGKEQEKNRKKKDRGPWARHRSLFLLPGRILVLLGAACRGVHIPFQMEIVGSSMT